jgi:F-type H+-transporting ATPase subunit a
VKGFDLFEHHTFQPFTSWGLTNSFWTLNVDTILYTWVALGITVLAAWLGRKSLKHPETVPGYLAEKVARSFINMTSQALEQFEYRYYAFIGSLFIFILICNVIVVLPFMEEPTKDLNTTIAFALCSFIYVQAQGIRTHGIGGYIAEFFKPFFLLFPLEVLGKLATIVSLSFRLFGNIFGGAVIGSMWNYAIAGSFWRQLAGLLLGVNFIIMLFFGIFEGVVQAFVFATLTLTYLGMATAREEHE